MFTKGLSKVAITLNKTLRLSAGGLSSRLGGSKAKHYKDSLKGFAAVQKATTGMGIREALKASKVITSRDANKATGGALRDSYAMLNTSIKKKNK